MPPHVLTVRGRVRTNSDLTPKALKIVVFKELATLRFMVKNAPTQSPTSQAIQAPWTYVQTPPLQKSQLFGPKNRVAGTSFFALT